MSRPCFFLISPIIASVLILSACSDTTAEQDASFKHAKSASAALLHSTHFGKELGLSKRGQDAIKQLAKQMEAVRNVERNGPGYKSQTIPFPLLRRPSDTGESFFRRRWQWFAAQVETELPEEDLKKIKSANLSGPTIKELSGDRGFTISWSVNGQSASTTTNMPGFIADVDEALKAVNDADKRRQREALDWLAGTQPDTGRRDDVVKALKTYLDADSPAKNHAIAAFGNWANADDIAYVRSLLDLQQSAQIEAAIRMLVRMKDDQLSELFVSRIENSRFRSRVQNALSSMGKEGETAAVALLPVENKKLFTTACGVLARIGGQHGLDALKAHLEAAKPHIDRGAAERAVGLIEARLKVNEPAAE